MRFLVHVAAMTLLATPPMPVPAPPLQAQATMPPSGLSQSAPAQATPAPATQTQPGSPAPTRKRRTGRGRQTLAERFDQANTTKDGHLTAAQADAVRWTYVTRNFDVMDKEHKGYITTDDIRAYAREQRALRAQQTQHSGAPPSRG